MLIDPNGGNRHLFRIKYRRAYRRPVILIPFFGRNMRFTIQIPPAGEAVKSCRLVKWHKEHRALVKAGECIATLETDKVSLDLEAEYSGNLLHEVDEGSELNVSQILGVIDDGGVSIGDLNKAPFKRRKADDDDGIPSKISRILLSCAKIFLMTLGLVHLYQIIVS